MVLDERAPTRRRSPGSPSRASAGSGGCAWPTSSAPRVAGRGRRHRITWSPWGSRSASTRNKLFAANAYRDYLEVHGLSVQLTEALAEYWHRRIRSELTFADGQHRGRRRRSRRPERFFDLDYRGCRYSFGYPACPDLEDRAKMVALLRPGADRRELSEEFQLHPEQATTALVVHHPEANYFAAR